MFFKQNLVDQSIFIKKVPEKFSDINFEAIKQDAMDSFDKKQSLSKDMFSYDKNYFKLKDRADNLWLYQFIRDYYKASTKTWANTLIQTDASYLILNRGSDVSTHNHIDDYDINNSPDYVALATIDAEDAFIEIDYAAGRKRQMKQRVPLIPQEVIVFNSELNYRYLLNKSIKNTIVLTFKLQLI